MTDETAMCRNCRRKLLGRPYYCGGRAYHPETGYKCPSNYYGGFVCSENCDRAVLFEMESSFPGSSGRAYSLSSGAAKRLKDNWSHLDD